MSQLVRRVGERILGSVSIPSWKWTFTVVDMPVENAFCVPGGHIVVFTGFFHVLENFALHVLTDRQQVDQIPPSMRASILRSPEAHKVMEECLAVVIAHEVGHAIGHHSVEQMVTRLLATGVDLVLGLEPGTTERLTIFGGLAFSRFHEREADHIGMHLMARACYHPKVAAAWWEFLTEHERRQQRGRRGPPEFFSTHPSHTSRAEDCRKYLSVVEPIRAESCNLRSPRTSFERMDW